MSDSVRSVDRIFDLMEILASQRKPISITELAERTDLSKTTAYRLMQTLVNRHYAEKTDNARYFLGPKIIELASYHIEHLELSSIARPFLIDLCFQYGLTAHLGKIVQGRVIYVELGNRNNIYETSGGYGAPIYCTAIGKCILASMSGSELDEMIYLYPIEKYTDKTITDINEYKKHLRQVRINGWAIEDEEYLEGKRCVAASIYDYAGNVIASISLRGDTEELSDANIPVIRDGVVKAAARISAKMGYLP